MNEPREVKRFILGSETGVSVGVIAIVAIVIVWSASKVLPTEAMVNRHEVELQGANQKLDALLQAVSRLEGKLEYMEKRR